MTDDALEETEGFTKARLLMVHRISTHTGLTSRQRKESESSVHHTVDNFMFFEMRQSMTLKEETFSRFFSFRFLCNLLS